MKTKGRFRGDGNKRSAECASRFPLLIDAFCAKCPDHRLRRGTCGGLSDPRYLCTRVSADGRFSIDWIPKTARKPTAADADAWGCILIWDRLDGVRISGWKNGEHLDRRSVTHWARMIPRPTSGNAGPWISKAERTPTPEDADAFGCIFIWDTLNGVMVTGYKNAGQLARENVTHFARIPQGPDPEEERL